MKTIKDAYEVLSGDWMNTFMSHGMDKFLYYYGADDCFVSLPRKTDDNWYQYICTVEEFNNYKGDDVKSVLDAAIEFKGEWPYIEDFICTPSSDNNAHSQGGFHSAKSKYPNEYWVNVCSKRVFNTLVDELASNMGTATQTYEEYKNDYGSVQLKDEATRFDLQTKPVYTQAMCDAGEMPSVGMECMVYVESDDGSVMEWLPAKVVGEYKCQPIIRLNDSKGAEGYFDVFAADKIKPLTPPIELIDGKAYQFTDVTVTCGVFSSRDDCFHNIDGLVCPEDCTNIKPLTVEGE